MWIVDLRPHGKRKYFSSKDAPLENKRKIQRTRLRNEGLEGLEFDYGASLLADGGYSPEFLSLGRNENP
jgi:hypothetical protein